MGGQPPPEGLNHSVFAFIPKGEDPRDTTDCIRDPGTLRPLSLENSDSKLLASTLNQQLQHLV
eukprot:882662-Pyramimonas_sp.AAC.1